MKTITLRDSGQWWGVYTQNGSLLKVDFTEKDALESAALFLNYGTDKSWSHIFVCKVIVSADKEGTVTQVNRD